MGHTGDLLFFSVHPAHGNLRSCDLDVLKDHVNFGMPMESLDKFWKCSSSKGDHFSHRLQVWVLLVAVDGLDDIESVG